MLAPVNQALEFHGCHYPFAKSRCQVQGEETVMAAGERAPSISQPVSLKTSYTDAVMEMVVSRGPTDTKPVIRSPKRV